jgi:hypothetical protein
VEPRGGLGYTQPVKELDTEIEIAASPARVWRELTDFASWGAWNPLLPAASGQLREGEQIRITLQAGKRAIRIKPRLLRVVPERELAWRGSLPVPGLFTGEHSFEIEALGDQRVRFRHREQFSGLLVPLMARMLDGQTRRGFEAMNAALKARAERA